MESREDEDAPEPEIEKPAPTRGKWLLDGFKALNGVGRLSRSPEPAAEMLALPAPPLEIENQETQTEKKFRAPRMRRSVWNNAQPVTIEQLVDAANDRIRVQALRPKK